LKYVAAVVLEETALLRDERGNRPRGERFLSATSVALVDKSLQTPCLAILGGQLLKG
jgi:hypothetical protein